MKESTAITLLVLVLLSLGAVYVYFASFTGDFTFSSAHLVINGNNVQETLEYQPNSDYHTLYRSFETKILKNGTMTSGDYINVMDVKCSNGMAYFRDYLGDMQIYPIYLPYTETNEYGCGFGYQTNFIKGEKYTVSATYELHPTVLFEQDGKYYTKFIVYAGEKHPLLILGKNLIIDGDVSSASFALPGSYLTIYSRYYPENLNSYQIVHVNSLSMSPQYGPLFFIIFIGLVPALFCFLVWFFFGKEKAEGDFPEELSQYPTERKAWEVSVYFHPPFGELDQNFLPTIILDFYYRKIIDITQRKTGVLFKQPEMFIKILPVISEKQKLDSTETIVMDWLKQIQEMEKPEDGYFSIRKAASGMTTGSISKLAYQNLKSRIKEKSKDHIDYKGMHILGGTLLAIFIIYWIFGDFVSVTGVFGYTFAFLIITCAIVALIYKKSSLFIRFKDDYYIEYQQWQGFRNYLSTLDSMKRTPPQGVVLWEKYLVYATALGVGKKVLETMKKLNVIDQKMYNNYVVIYSPTAFGSFSSPQGGGAGGGVGGGGFGGIGGGGGGGR